MSACKSAVFAQLLSSVADLDPNPDPPDPHIFGPSGSGSICQRYRYGSGSGSCFGSGSFYHKAKIFKKLWFLLFCDFFLTFLSLKNDVKVPSKSSMQKKFFDKICFVLPSWRSVMKIEGSGSKSGSISQRRGSPDPDPHQNVMDPQHSC